MIPGNKNHFCSACHLWHLPGITFCYSVNNSWEFHMEDWGGRGLLHRPIKTEEVEEITISLIKFEQQLRSRSVESLQFCINCLDDSNCSTTTQQPSDNNDFHSDVRMLQGFKIAHLNVNRLGNKLDHVKELVHRHSFDILTLSETWLVPNIMDNEIMIPGYSLVHKDRHSLTKSCGGGVIIFVRDGIPYVVMSDLIKHNFECLWVEIKRPKCKRMILCCS